MTGHLACQRSPTSKNTSPPKSAFSSLRQPHCHCGLVDSSVSAEALSMAMETFTDGFHPAVSNHFSTDVCCSSNVLYAFSSLGLKSDLCVCPNPSLFQGLVHMPAPHHQPTELLPPRLPPALGQLPPSFHRMASCQTGL